MKIEKLAIRDVLIITPERMGDARGFFSETYSREKLRASGIDVEFVQDNHSLSRQKGVLRGLHFQKPPFAQDKLVRVTRGAVLDVAVDIRRTSDSYGRHVSAVLSAENWTQMFVPKGFAHGFVTLEADTEVQYKVSDVYAPEHESGIAWNDPALAIDWPVGEDEVILSEKDRQYGPLDDLADSGF